MLQIFRDSAHKWFVKLLFWLLVLSFGLWGIGDVVYKFFTKPLARVGKHAISYEDFNYELQKQVAQMQALAKQPLTTEQVKALGLQKIAIDRLVDEAVITEELEERNMGTSDEMIKEIIHSQPAFQTDGRFDPNRFLNILQNRHLNERSFIKEMHFNVLQQQFMLSIAAGASLPGFYKNALLDALTKQYVFVAVEVDASKMKFDADISSEQLHSFYDQIRERYAVPEFRNITVMYLDKGAIRQLLNITPEQVQKIYDSKKADLQYPERRALRSLAYSQQDKAQKALELAQKGVLFDKIAQDVAGGTLEDVPLTPKDALPEFAANKIFATNVGKCTDVIASGAGGFYIFLITKIEAPRTPTFEEVKDALEENLIQEQKSTKFEDIRNQIEDSLAAGKNLSQIADTLKLRVENINAINAQGFDFSGKPVFAKPTALQQMVLQKAFAVEQGMESGLVDVQGEGAFVLFVNKVTPSYIPVFEDIKESIRQDFEAEKRLEEAAQIANTITFEAKSIDTLMELANKYNLVLSTNHTMNRIDTGKKERKSFDLIPPSLAEKAMMIARDTAIAGRNNKGGYTIVMLQKVGEQKASKQDAENINRNLNAGHQEDIAASTVDALRFEYDIEINQNLIGQMVD